MVLSWPDVCQSLNVLLRVKNTTHFFPHYEEGFASQLSFKKQVQSLIDVVNSFGNPFVHR